MLSHNDVIVVQTTGPWGKALKACRTGAISGVCRKIKISYYNILTKFLLKHWMEMLTLKMEHFQDTVINHWQHCIFR